MQDRAKGIECALEPSEEDRLNAESIHDPEKLVEVLLDPARRGELYPYYHRLRELSPIHQTEVAGFPPGTFVLTRGRDVDRIARSGAAVNDPRTASVWDYEGTGDGAFFKLMSHAMLFLEKAAHDRVRRLVYKAFTPAAVAPLRTLTRQVAHELLDAATGTDSQMNFVADFAYPLPLRAIMRLLGIPREYESTIEQWAWDFARAGDPMSATPEIIERGNQAATGFSEFFSELLDQRRAHPGEDLITALLHAGEDGGVLSREETISTLVLLLQAGHDTTSDLLGNALVGLFRHPSELARIVERRDLLPDATEELLRYDTSVQISMRLARERIQLEEFEIPAGSMIALCYGAANRDPALHPDPDRLDLERRPAHLSFSAGAYYCLGNALARTEIQAALDVLFERLPGIRPARDHFTQRWTTRLRGPLALEVSWD